MSARLCRDAVPLNTQCPSQNPFSNLSSEAEDDLDYLSTYWAYGPDGGVPPFGQPWTALSCGVTYISQISQLDANLQAAAAAMNCAGNKTTPIPPATPSNPSGQLFFNEPQTYCVSCPYPPGGLSCFTVLAGLFQGINQAQANAFAYVQAQIWAVQYMFCFGACPPPGEVGVPYLFQLTASGGTPPYTFSIADEGGTLPDGLSLSSSGLISGTPTTAMALNEITFSVSDSGLF